MGNFSTNQLALDEITTFIQAERKRIQQGKSSISQADAGLALMPTTYAAIIAEINADAAAAPADDVLRLNAERLGKLVDEFTALKTVSAAAKAALDTITV